MREIVIDFDNNIKDSLQVRLIIFKKILSKIKSEYNPKKFLDLATGHGKFALAARDLGFKVTAIDARPNRMPFNESNIEWIVSTVENFNVSGFEIVNCVGLLYHLPLRRQIELVKRLDCNILIFDSHLANVNERKIKDLKYEGKIYKEADNFDILKGQLLAAFDNLESFWHTKESLEMLILNNGFDNVYEIVPWYYVDRTFFIAKRKVRWNDTNWQIL